MKFILLALLFLLSVIYVPFADSQEEADSILSPPVDIQFTFENTPMVEGEALLKVTVMPQEDMHVDISCLLPEGVEAVLNQGVSVRPHEESHGIDSDLSFSYKDEIILWVGPLKAGEPKEFLFKVKFLGSQNHELVARIKALAKWGVKDQVLSEGGYDAKE
ncbi:MAG: hypothetical protein ACM3L6_01740 [Deltaproteobacteria bacterium]